MRGLFLHVATEADVPEAVGKQLAMQAGCLVAVVDHRRPPATVGPTNATTVRNASRRVRVRLSQHRRSFAGRPPVGLVVSSHAGSPVEGDAVPDGEREVSSAGSLNHEPEKGFFQSWRAQIGPAPV